jgi:hypothetical protein
MGIVVVIMAVARSVVMVVIMAVVHSVDMEDIEDTNYGRKL